MAGYDGAGLWSQHSGGGGRRIKRSCYVARLASLDPPYLCLLSAGIIGVNHHIWLIKIFKCSIWIYGYIYISVYILNYFQQSSFYTQSKDNHFNCELIFNCKKKKFLPISYPKIVSELNFLFFWQPAQIILFKKLHISFLSNLLLILN
jgi:hypothetical protein